MKRRAHNTRTSATDVRELVSNAIERMSAMARVVNSATEATAPEATVTEATATEATATEAMPTNTAPAVAEPNVVLEYGAAVRGILNDNHGGPLHPPGERMAEALTEVRHSLQRNLEAKKGGPRRTV